MTHLSSILFLTLSSFNDTGGIQKVCRVLCKSLSSLSRNLQVISLCDETSALDERYLQPSQFKGFGYRKIRFTLYALKQALKMDMIILSHVNLLPLAVIIKFMKPATTIILLCHGIEIWRPLSKWKKKCLQRDVVVWAVSHFTAEKLIKIQGIHPEKVVILNNCLDPYFEVPTATVKPRYLLDRYHLHPKQEIMFTLTRISADEHDKGYDEVIDSMPLLLKEHPTLCYLLGGNAEQHEFERLTEIINRRGLQQHVKLIGFIADDELTDHYLLADVFVLISKKEGFGLVFIEAAACGCRIVCGNKDGSTDAVLNGRLGIKVHPQQSKKLRSAIRTSLLHKQNSNVSAKIQYLCLTHFNFEAYTKNVARLLNQVA